MFLENKENGASKQVLPSSRINSRMPRNEEIVENPKFDGSGARPLADTDMRRSEYFFSSQ